MATAKRHKHAHWRSFQLNQCRGAAMIAFVALQAQFCQASKSSSSSPSSSSQEQRQAELCAYKITRPAHLAGNRRLGGRLEFSTRRPRFLANRLPVRFWAFTSGWQITRSGESAFLLGLAGGRAPKRRQLLWLLPEGLRCMGEGAVWRLPCARACAFTRAGKLTQVD